MWAALWAAACFALAYLPDVGRGFIKDDYGWIVSSRIDGWASLWRPFVETPMGFYRPLVSLSFGLNELVTGAHPFAYALTNVALALAIAAGIFALGRRLGLPSGAAVFAAAVWLFNFHGINMSLLWISGRTSLLGTLGAVAAACAWSSSRFWLAGALTLAALLSKEEPLLLPVVFTAWLALDRSTGARDGGRNKGSDGDRPWSASLGALLPPFVAVAVYLALRAQTAALTPANAPSFYRLSIDAIGGNAVQYLDRSLTFPVALLLIGLLGASRQALTFSSAERTIVLKGAVWLVLGFGLTIMVPVRSSLYVCLPTVGSALAAAACGNALWRAARRPALTLGALLFLPLALVPVYWSRNVRTKNEAVLATRTLDAIRRIATTADPDRIVIVSSPADRPSIADAFADALPLALTRFVPEAASTTVVVQPTEESAGGGVTVLRASELAGR